MTTDAKLLADEIESVGKGLGINGRSIEGGRELLPEEDALVIRALRAYVSSDADKRDAERYRFLRVSINCREFRGAAYGSDRLADKALDAAVDKALAWLADQNSKSSISGEQP